MFSKILSNKKVLSSAAVCSVGLFGWYRLQKQSGSSAPEPTLYVKKVDELKYQQGALLAEDAYYQGRRYEYGLGVAENKTEAFRFYEQAAEKNNAAAQYKLGQLYENENPKDAFNFYKQAAENKHAMARFKLAQCFEKGLGVPVDLAEAQRWYTKAAKKGCEQAQTLLNPQVRGPMILIEGLDLAGKTTLTKSVMSVLSEHYRVKYSRNTLVLGNPVDVKAQQWRREPGADLRGTGSLFLAAHYRDANTFHYPKVGKMHIQESSWLRTLAFHSLNNPDQWIPGLVEDAAMCQPQFDVVVYLTAGIEVRQARVLQREKESPGENDEADYLPVRNPEKFKKMDQLLERFTKENHPNALFIRVDTTNLTKQEVLDSVVSQLPPSLLELSTVSTRKP